MVVTRDRNGRIRLCGIETRELRRMNADDLAAKQRDVDAHLRHLRSLARGQKRYVAANLRPEVRVVKSEVRRIDAEIKRRLAASELVLDENEIHSEMAA